MLTNEELATAIQAGDQELMEQLWRQCYGFIRQQAIRWARAWENRADFELDDLINSGYFALCGACSAFQPGRGTFINLLDMCIKTTFSEVAGCRTMAQKMEPLNNALSLDFSPNNTDGKQDGDDDRPSTLKDIVPDPNRADLAIDDDVFMLQLCELLHSKVAQLPEKERTAIEMRYWQNCPYKAIADALQCSMTSATVAVKNGLDRLKKQDTDGTLRNLLDELYYVEANLYRHTGFSSWKRTGMSVQEYEVTRKEAKVQEQVNRLNKRKQKQEQQKREEDLAFIMRVLGVDRERAEKYLPFMTKADSVA